MKPTRDVDTPSPSTAVPADPQKSCTPVTVEQPSVGVEVVMFTVVDAELKVLLMNRHEHPFKGCWSLPGGLVRVSNHGDQGEHIDDAAHRIVLEATQIERGTYTIDQLYTFGKAGRDPRARVISIAWTALMSPDQIQPESLRSESDIRWFGVNEETPWMRLSFDHAEILDTAVNHIREQIDRNHAVFQLMPKAFTVTELKDTHEAIMCRRYDARNFRRRFQRLVNAGIVAESRGKRHRGKARPAKLWRFLD